MSVEIRCILILKRIKIKVLPPSRRQATVHWTAALDGSNLSVEKMKSECRDSLHFDSRENQNQGVAAVEPSASNCPPDSCIELFESLT